MTTQQQKLLFWIISLIPGAIIFFAALFSLLSMYKVKTLPFQAGKQKEAVVNVVLNTKKDILEKKITVLDDKLKTVPEAEKVEIQKNKKKLENKLDLLKKVIEKTDKKAESK